MRPLEKNQRRLIIGSKPKRENTQVREIEIAAIKVNKGRREVNPVVVDGIVKSIRRNGLLAPVVLCRVAMSAKRYVLVDGAHRLEAFRRLGRKSIAATIVSSELAEVVELSGNVDRNDLDALQRAEAVARLARILREDKAAKSGGAQPHDRGVSRLARNTGFSRKQVAAAMNHAKLPGSVKYLARKGGLHNNSAFLTSLLKLPSEVDQIQAINEKVRDRNSMDRKANKPKADGGPFLPDFHKLEKAWKGSAVCRLYQRASSQVQQAFIRKIFG